MTWRAAILVACYLLMFVGAVLLVVLPAMRAAWLWVKPTAVTVGQPETYRGFYVAHWEVGHFIFDTGRQFLFVLPVYEKWHLRFLPGFELPWSEEFGGRPKERVHGRWFEIEFVGVVGVRGWFGHMGMCDREVTVVQVLSAMEVPRKRKSSF